jgi:hypothetical protein
MDRSINRGSWRALSAMVAALALVLVLTHSVSAATKVKGRVTVTAQQYANICDDYGASDISVGKNSQGHTTVSCSWSNGVSSTCDFKTKTCDDTIPRTVPGNPLRHFNTAINVGVAQPASTPTPAPIRAAMCG